MAADEDGAATAAAQTFDISDGEVSKWSDYKWQLETYLSVAQAEQRTAYVDDSSN